MKKNLVVVLFLLIGLTVNAQKQPNCSVEIQWSLPYYFVYNSYTDINYLNFPNGGVAFKLNRWFGKWVKIGVGLSYSTKNYAVFHRKEYYMDYRNIPLELEVKLIHKPKWNLGVLQGVIMNYRYNYDVVLYDDNLSKTYYSGKGYYKEEAAYTYRLGGVFSYHLTSVLNANIGPYVDFKYKMDRADDGSRDPREVGSTDEFSMGLNIGLEYKFNVNE